MHQIPLFPAVALRLSDFAEELGVKKLSSKIQLNLPKSRVVGFDGRNDNTFIEFARSSSISTGTREDGSYSSENNGRSKKTGNENERGE